MGQNFIKTAAIQQLLDRAAGTESSEGNARLKTITRDLLEAIMALIVRHDVTESEFWEAVSFLQNGAGEFGLILPGVGLEHFMDLVMDARDAEAGLTGGTPRTIEGPLYVEGAPLVEGKPLAREIIVAADDPGRPRQRGMGGGAAHVSVKGKLDVEPSPFEKHPPRRVQRDVQRDTRSAPFRALHGPGERRWPIDFGHSHRRNP